MFPGFNFPVDQLPPELSGLAADLPQLHRQQPPGAPTYETRRVFGPYDRGDGVGTYADPIRVHRRLKAMLDGDPARVIAQSRAEVAVVAMEAKDRVLAAAVRALDLLPFDPATGQGATEDQVVEALNAYLKWEEETRDFFASSPTPAPSSAAPPSPSGASPPPTPAPTTAPSSASGSTPDGCGCS